MTLKARETILRRRRESVLQRKRKRLQVALDAVCNLVEGYVDFDRIAESLRSDVLTTNDGDA